MEHLAADDWLCGSRRHIGGAGDVLAVRRMLDSPQLEAMLTEVKTTAGGPYERFGPKDRAALKAEAARVGAVPMLAWRPPRARAWTMLGIKHWP